MSQINFVIARLGDNDFGFDLSEALYQVANANIFERVDQVRWKPELIAFVISRNLVKTVINHKDPINWEQLQHFEQYLNEHLTISFERFPPTEAHDHGSAYLDIHTMDTWTY